jgi:proton glutamate symport protein
MKFKKLTLTHYIFIGLLLGLISGTIAGEDILPVADPLSELFLRLLRMTIIPLIITSIISGVLSIGTARGLGRLGVKTFVYYITSSLLAIITGLFLVNLFRPGVGANIDLKEVPQKIEAAQQSIGELLFRIIPENPFQSMATGDVLPVIFFCILFAYFITRLNDPYRTHMTHFFQGAFQAMMKLTHVVIWTAPVGVFGITARITATSGFGAFKSLGFYFLVVLLGLFVHAFISLPILLKLIARINPYSHYKGMLSALLTAFSTCSSMVTLPLTIKATTENSKVSSKISSFMLPIGATVNMDGTALYECVATIFIAQVYGFDLGFGQQVIVVLTALLASIGAAGVPMAGLVMMSIILTAVGLPLELVGIILAVDRILDMFRTTVNVLSDSCGCVIVARLEGESLEGIGESD